MSFVEGTRGRRFSQLYMTHGAPTQDSGRMRRRIAAIWPAHDREISDLIYERLGELVPTDDWTGSCQWLRYFERAPLHDVLDAITIAAEVSRSNRFLELVATIFLEENVGYRVDDDGVVHFAVDAEYERAAQSIIRGLDNPRYTNVLTAFRRIQPELDKDPPDGKLAIRASFDAVEALFKLMFPRAPRLAAGEIDAHLTPSVNARAQAGAETRALSKWVLSLKDWVEACHFYRHEQGQPEPHQPPLDLAIALISAGASYLRWMVAYDQPDGPSSRQEEASPDGSPSNVVD